MYGPFLHMIFFNTLIQVVWTQLYCKGTSSENGTLPQSKNLINRTSVPRDPKNDTNSNEEFFEIIFAAHAISAVTVHFDMGSVNDNIRSNNTRSAVVSFPDLHTQQRLHHRYMAGCIKQLLRCCLV